MLAYVRKHWDLIAESLSRVLAGCGIVTLFWPGDHDHIAACCLLWAWLLTSPTRPRHTPLAPDQAIVTTPTEPSADARAFAHVVTQMRAALMNEGMSSEQARQTLKDVFEANARGQQP